MGNAVRVRPRAAHQLTEGRTAYIHAELRDPQSILSNPSVREILDFSRPIALMLVVVLHFVPDEFEPTYVTRATAPLPPFFLAAGTSDHLVPHQQTLILADALRAHGTQVELHILENGRHGDQRFETELKQQAIEWLEQSRKPS